MGAKDSLFDGLLARIGLAGARMAAWADYFHFAWHGSGPRWAAMPIQLVGSASGGGLMWWWGVQLPHEIIDNPALAAIAAIVIGGIAGVIFVFVIRLCWAPIHFRLAEQGGLRTTLQSKLGELMWPAILMSVGLFSFALFFGGGLIWFVTIAQRATAPIALAY